MDLIRPPFLPLSCRDLRAPERGFARSRHRARLRQGARRTPGRRRGAACAPTRWLSSRPVPPACRRATNARRCSLAISPTWNGWPRPGVGHAGPFAEDKDVWRGLFLFAVTDIEEARELTRSDPVMINGEMVPLFIAVRMARGDGRSRNSRQAHAALEPLDRTTDHCHPPGPRTRCCLRLGAEAQSEAQRGQWVGKRRRVSTLPPTTRTTLACSRRKAAPTAAGSNLRRQAAAREKGAQGKQARPGSAYPASRISRISVRCIDGLGLRIAADAAQGSTARAR